MNDNKKILSKLLGCSLLLTTLFSAGCETTSSSQNNNAEIYSCYITEKVLQDSEESPVTKQDAKFAITAAIGESEAAQIIIRPERDVKKVGFSVGKLVSKDGVEFPAENVSAYYQKYIEVKTRSDGFINTPLGWYPDMLLPFEKAVEYKENVIKAGENQGIVLSAKVTAEQASGVYTGKAILKLDEKEIEVPVSIDVRNVVLPDLKTLKSCFNTDYELVIDGELDDTMDMYEAYCSALIEYELNPRILPGTYGTIDDFKAAVRKWYDQVTSYEIPAEKASNWIEGYLREHLIAVAEISLEDGINYFEKARYWLYSVDEPGHNGTEDKATARINEFHQILSDTAAEIEAWNIEDNGDVTKELLAQFVRDGNAMIAGYTDTVDASPIWVAGVGSMRYDDKKYEVEHKEESEIWTYTVNSSVNPQPNFTIDDMNGLTAYRSIGWMCNDNDLAGILYYETCYMQAVSFSGGFHYVKCDPYAEAMRYPGTNGDGWMLYPGARYGIYGPIASIRFVAARDAVEDFELLYQLEKKYELAGYDASEILRVVYDSIYATTLVSADGATFFNAREQVFRLHALADEGVYFSKCTGTTAGFDFEISTGKDVETKIKLNDQNVQAQDLSTDTNIVKAFSVALNQDSQELCVVASGIEFVYNLGGKRVTVVDYSAENPVGVANSSLYQHSIVDASVVGEMGMVEKVEFKSNEKTIFIRPTNVNNYLNVNTHEATFIVYNPMQEKVRVSLYIEGEVASPMNNYYLFPGKNVITLKGISMANWKAIKKATGFRLAIYDETELTTLYLGNIQITGRAQ